MEKDDDEVIRFDSKLFTLALEIGMIYLQRGVNKFADWQKVIIERIGDKIDIWLPAIWKTLGNYPANTKFNSLQISAIARYTGVLIEKGQANSFEEAILEFEKAVGKEKFEKFNLIFKAVYIGIIKFFEDNYDFKSQLENVADLAKEVIALQLTLDEEIVVGNIPLNGMPISGTDKIFYDGDYHMMHITLVRYKDRRYIAISRMHYRKLKRTGKIKKTFRNSIWIPISRIKDVIELLKHAEIEADNLHWEDNYIGEDLTVSAQILDEGESKKRRLTNVRETSRIFLISSANYLEDKLTLKVNVKAIAEQLNLSLTLVLRVIDYLEDAGYIKQVEKLNSGNSNAKENLIKYLPKIINLLPNDDIENIISDKAKKISGLSDEVVEFLDCLDDNDPKISRWNYAKRFAETEIISEFIAGQIPISFEITAAGYDWIE